MKKGFLLFSLALSAFAANAQYSISGSSYTQNFDGVSTGLPNGWSVYSGSSSTSIGTISSFNNSVAFGLPSYPSTDSTCIAEVAVGGFKNFPSADVAVEGADYCTTPPPSYANRAIGVRQVSPTNASHPNLDSGAAFVFELANTSGVHSLNLAFELQSLDTSSPRVTKWQVDYSIGSTTGFTQATSTTGIFTTGGNTFASNPCTVDFGTALDNSTQPIYIRIATLDFSSGSGNRPSSAIDNYSLTWSGTPTSVSNVATESASSLTVIGQAFTDKITLAYNVAEAGAYAMSLYDITGRVLHAETINAQVGTGNINLNGLRLVPGMYFAKLQNANSSSVARVSVQ